MVRAAYAWNLAVEVARQGASATLVASGRGDASPLWPEAGRGPVGTEVELSTAETGIFLDNLSVIMLSMVAVLADAELSHSRGARMGSLRWRCLERFDRATLVEVRPRTGHQHQIRATFAHLGFPIAGDSVYGAPADATGAPRQMLHAAHAAFGEVAASSPDPADFVALCERLRGG